MVLPFSFRPLFVKAQNVEDWTRIRLRRAYCQQVGLASIQPIPIQLMQNQRKENCNTTLELPGTLISIYSHQQHIAIRCWQLIQ